jgi:hypothetical protein
LTFFQRFITGIYKHINQKIFTPYAGYNRINLGSGKRRNKMNTFPSRPVYRIFAVFILKKGGQNG